MFKSTISNKSILHTTFICEKQFNPSSPRLVDTVTPAKEIFPDGKTIRAKSAEEIKIAEKERVQIIVDELDWYIKGFFWRYSRYHG